MHIYDASTNLLVCNCTPQNFAGQHKSTNNRTVDLFKYTSAGATVTSGDGIIDPRE